MFLSSSLFCLILIWLHHISVSLYLPGLKKEYLSERQSNRGRSSICNNWDWTSLKLEARNSFLVFHVDGKDLRTWAVLHCLHRCTSTRRQGWNMLRHGMCASQRQWNALRCKASSCLVCSFLLCNFPELLGMIVFG